MPFEANAHFRIGANHIREGKPCQDYALAEATDTYAFAIVSDGCSSGDAKSPIGEWGKYVDGKTDIGARLLTLTTAKSIKERLSENSDVSKILPTNLLAGRDALLTGMREQLNLTSNDMLATCLHACVNASGGYVHVHGDGVVALRYSDGRVIVHSFDWAKSMPFYPAYTGYNRQNFVANQQESNEPLTQETWDVHPDEAYLLSETNYTVEEGVNGITIPVELHHEVYGNLTHVILLSDGVEQVDNYDPIAAYRAFTRYKGVGLFAVRWLNKAVKDSQKIGKGPTDDISCAVISIKEDA